MKLKILILLSIIFICVTDMHSQKDTTKRDAANSTTTVEGSFTLDESVVKLFSNGNVEFNGKTNGVYSHLGGEAYKVKIDDDAWFVYLIIGNNVYEVGAGSAGVITDFDFDPSDSYITITEIDGGNVTEDDLESIDLSSPELPITDLFIVSKVDWDKTSSGQTYNSTSDKNFVGIMNFCNPGNEDEGPTGKTAREIMNSIQASGYILEDTFQNLFSIEDPIEDEFYDVEAISYSYSNGSNSILCVFQMDDNKVALDKVPYEIIITESESEMRDFVKNALTEGFVKENEDMGELYVAVRQPAGVSFNVIFGDDAFIQINFFDSH